MISETSKFKKAKQHVLFIKTKPSDTEKDEVSKLGKYINGNHSRFKRFRAEFKVIIWTAAFVKSLSFKLLILFSDIQWFRLYFEYLRTHFN